MSLSNELISKFVKITNDFNRDEPKEGTVYGTAVEYEGEIYVKIDGSDLLTPIDTTADIKEGERVTVMIKNHNATVSGNISSPSASSNDVKKVTQDVESIGSQITEFEIIVADKVSTKELDAEVARIDTLIAGKATIEELEAVDAKIKNLDVEVLEAVNAKIENLEAKDAHIENLVADNLKATNAEIEILDAEVADIKTLVNGNLTSDNILSFHITADNVTMDDAFISDAMIANVSAGKISSGHINTNLVNIQSEDGSMLINGSTQQFKDDEGNVRIQIGKDESGDFTFILYGEDGKGQILNQNGITSSAIADGLIVNSMVSDNAAISGGKLDISSVITEINDDNSTTIKSNKIYLNDQKQSLEVAFNSLKTKVDMIQDVTIDGDLSSVIAQVQTNTTQINVNKEGINALVAEDNILKKQITDLNGEVSSVEETLSSKYTSLEQNVNGFKTSVADTYVSKGEFKGLQIGGRNLLLDTSTPKSIVGNNGSNQTMLLYTISDPSKVTGDVTFSFTYIIDGYESGDIKIQTRPTQYMNLLDPSIKPTEDGVFHYTHTATINLGTISFKEIQIRLDNFIGSVTISEMKLEQGEKATTWTPAPEDLEKVVDDLDSNLTSNYSTTSAMNSAINQKANEITSSVSSTYATKTSVTNLSNNLSNNYSTTSAMNSAINQKANEITSSVSSTYATKTSLNNLSNDLSNLSIGSRNLVREKSGYKYGYLRSSTGDQVDTGSLNGNKDAYSTFYIQVKKDEEYTLTAYDSTENITGAITLLFYDANKQWISSHPIHHDGVSSITPKSKIVKMPSDGYIRYSRRGYGLLKVKLEKGNKATDWTPAPEDIQSDIDGITNNLSVNYSTTSAMNSAINQKANEITSSVSSTYATKTSVTNLSNNLSNNYSTTSAMNSAINQKGDSILSTVSGTYATKTSLNTTNTNVTNLTSRVSTAESKLTKSSLTTTIGDYYTTSSTVNDLITSKNYATTSQLSQTSDSLIATFKENGGYNKVRNGGFLSGDLTHWNGWGTCTRYVADTTIMGFTKKVVLEVTGSNQGIQQTITGLTPNKTYTASVIAQVESGQCMLQIYDSSAGQWLGAYLPTGTKGPTVLSKTFKPAGSSIVMQLGRGGGGSNGIFFFTGAMLTEGEYALPWSPHPSEVYDGIVKINKDGIRVAQSNYNGATAMTSQGFYINNGTEDVFKATASGLFVKGNITATSGKIAGFSISGDSLVGNNVGMCGLSGTNYAFWAGSNTSSSAPFRVGHGGAVVATDLTVNGGSINIAGKFKVSTAGALTTESTILAKGGIYTYQDIRGMDSADGSGGLTVVTNTGDLALRNESGAYSVYLQAASGHVYVTAPKTKSDYIALHTGRLYANNVLEFSGSNRIIRVHSNNHLYLQCGTTDNTGATTSEVRCTRSEKSDTYANLRAYNLCAQNAVFANGVNVSSDRDRKRDIELYSVDAVREICSTPVYTYHLDTDLNEEIKRIGIIMQEAPLDAIDLSGKGVDLYQMTTMLWRAVQQQQDMIDELQKEIKGEC